ncbi:RNA polymerase sigma factor [Haliangium sp.]|uniref:RNA polymerase sigma factor n=1 Tax=Haliangium sp. TaxID=2663208 RepID=UPI003D0EF264
MNKQGTAASIPAHDDAERAPSRRRHGKRTTRAAEPVTGPDDHELVERARGGDQEAFRLLYQRYHRRVYSLAFGVVRNQEDALDVVQEGFIKAHRYLDKFEGASSFYTWLYRIVMNLSIDHIRKHKRNRHVDFNDAIDHGQGDPEVGEDSLLPRILGQNPGKALARKEIREQISKALAELSDKHRAVLVMRELEGMSYEEMAEAMECSKGTIMSRLFHARKNMQKRLLEYMGGQKDFEA